jgi:hypothetical protein
MTRAKDISKIVTDANLSGTLDVTGEVTTADDIKFTSGARHKFVGGGTGNNLELGTYSSSNTSRDVHLEIDSAGNVGIGTSPSHQLHVQASGNGKVRFEGNLNSNTSDLLISHNSSGDSGLQFNSNQLNMFTYGDIAFYANTGNISGGYPSGEVMRIRNNGRVGIGTSSPARDLHIHGADSDTHQLHITNSTTGTTGNDGVSFALGSDESLIINQRESNVIKMMTNDTERMRITDGGNVGINESSADTKLHVSHNASATPLATFENTASHEASIRFKSAHSSNSDFRVGASISASNNFEIYSVGAATARLKITSTGQLLVPRVAGDTTSDSANVNIRTSDGLMRRSTSSRRFKNTINDATNGLTELLQLRSVTFKGNNDGDIIFGGLIAEEVHDAGLTEFVQYNDDGEPDALAYGNMVSLCIKGIQELKAELDSAKARITALENGE